jgi:outer membrane receptor protein involved in Fe transport
VTVTGSSLSSAVFGIAASLAIASPALCQQEPEADRGKPGERTSPDEAEIVVFGRAEAKIGVATAASEGTISGADLLVRPLLRTAELLEAVPGMIAAQHSGSGKANQYFLRGFNLDHGSDFTTYIDGVQMNFRTHGHGQGYLDLNGLIPEIIGREDFRKGPYKADGGDFALAGAAYMRTIDRFDAPWASVEWGSFGGRKLAAGATLNNVAGGELTLIGQAKHYDGPWQAPERLRHYSGFAKYVVPLGSKKLAISVHAYEAKWKPTEQIPERIVGSAICPDVFCAPDPTASGKTSRTIANVQLTGDTFQANAYVQFYDWRMSSNPTYANPDGSSAQIEQFDRRRIYGAKADWQSTANAPLRAALGTELRYDDMPRVGVANTGGGSAMTSLGTYRVKEGSAALHGELTWQPIEQLRLVAGLRGDHYFYSVRALDPQAAALGQGRGSQSLLSPKASVAFTAAPWLEFYGNIGRGFHSNDVRGAVTVTPVPVLVRGTGKEVGGRLHLNAFNLTATYWWLDVGSELRFVGDSNAVEPTGASRRHGFEIVGFWQPRSWLAIDANFTKSSSRYRSGEYIPNAFENAGQLGVSIVQPRWEAAVRLRHLGPYPLIEDNSQRDKGSNVVNLRAAFKPGRFELYGEILNLLDSRDKDIAYYYESFIPGFDSAPVDGRLSRVVEPRTLRIGARVIF